MSLDSFSLLDLLVWWSTFAKESEILEIDPARTIEAYIYTPYRRNYILLIVPLLHVRTSQRRSSLNLCRRRHLGLSTLIHD